MDFIRYLDVSQVKEIGIMITYFILYFIYLVIYAITSPLRLLNDAVLPADVSSALSQAGGYLGAINDIVPIPSLLTILGLVLATEGFILTYKGIMWLIKRLPTQS